MVLLTSSTVSVIISSGIICTFTFLLFLSGYVLQQQSVRNIQHAIRAPELSLTPHNEGQPLLLNTPPNQQPQQQQNPITQPNQDPTPAAQGTYAYLQLLTRPDPSHICSAILFFHSLTAATDPTNRTRIQDRLFMYPREWDQLYTPSNPSNPSSLSDTTDNKHTTIIKALTHLRTAALANSIWLLPIDTGHQTTDPHLLRHGQMQFVSYDSVLYLQTPGLVTSVPNLDAVLLSHPLPGKHDPARPDSYNNPAWMAVPLRPDRESVLPGNGAYLVTVNRVGSVGQVEARGHVMRREVKEGGFGGLVRGVDVDTDTGAGEEAGYVVFETEEDGRVRWEGNELYGAWRRGVEGVCPGVEFEGFYD
ncbi:hypothetical protein ASPACDRAFT_1888360 [Aspergillus aculeatus ATCC 16872]|uniref:Uncharacterized protein n=1 Tax=Aspergillus aculeatus (strain ATCC 16872 / CBS 172.66 / WB 5094) TaxID=690307 RepID=A0A1L9WUV9_ASPA1|nr:uncharacterized protein ASPACDRAFT_1888360 [Aspergillus aculeatus ATCC 16872]OJJ99687.1 hypothetical protein ASPACDRAFT_1888360 [Aspergillus aculeatus ATCC 16872]